VVELFVLALPARYLEIELGPHGHHLVLQLDGVRNVIETVTELDYDSAVTGARWRGRAVLPSSQLPDWRSGGRRSRGSESGMSGTGASRVNAYAIHGRGTGRRYLAAYPVPGPVPDFHRLECFGPLEPELTAVHPER